MRTNNEDLYQMYVGALRNTFLNDVRSETLQYFWTFFNERDLSFCQKNLKEAAKIAQAIADGNHVLCGPKQYRIKLKGVSNSFLHYHNYQFAFSVKGIANKFTKDFLDENWADYHNYLHSGLIELLEVDE